MNEFEHDRMPRMLINEEHARAPRVLIIEDDPNHYALIERSVSRAIGGSDIEVVHLQDGAAAMEYLRSGVEHPDLMILDLKLPKLNGHQVLEQIKTDDSLRTIPVVVLSTSLNSNDCILAYRLHANSVLTKAIDFNAFHQMLTDTVRYWICWNSACPLVQPA